MFVSTYTGLGVDAGGNDASWVQVLGKHTGEVHGST